MITVTIKENKFTVKGHANYAPRGQDIICAGVSAIVGSVILTAEETGVEFKRNRCEEGHIECEVHNKILMDVLRYGLLGIEEQYPEHVRVVDGS